MRLALVAEAAGKVFWARTTPRDPARAEPEMLIDAGARVISAGAPHTLGNGDEASRGRRVPIAMAATLKS